ncbi:MAG TPA: hypothetical protein VKB66_05425 [Candidatus Acidoferrum sp.]|nr:hypothetical protein [Candidatus Acidoferrum sp.]
MSAAHRLTAFIRYPPINHSLGTQPKDQVLGVLTVTYGNADEIGTVLVVALVDVAGRSRVQHVLTRLESREHKSPIVPRGGSSCVVAKRNRNLRARHRAIGYSIQYHATDTISASNLAL